MQFQCLKAIPQSGSTVLFYMVNSHQQAPLKVCLKVARLLNTRYFWSVGFLWLGVFTEVGLVMQEWQEYFSLMVVLVYLHGN